MKKKLKVLNLYAGIGGNRKLWEDVEVTAVEMNESIAEVYQEFYPEDKVIVGDAHQYLLDNHYHFDFIWSSPPCPSHSRINTDGQQLPRFPEMSLYEEIIFLSNNWYKGKWVVENVIPYYEPLIKPTANLDRHLYWSNFRINPFSDFSECSSIEMQNNKERFGINIEGTGIKDKRKSLRNLVDPAVGLHILNCARNIITKSNTRQTELFNES